MRLLNNKQASFAVLQKLGFCRKKNLLLFQSGNVAPTIQDCLYKVDFTFFESNPHITPELKLFVQKALFNYTYIDRISDTPIATVYDYSRNCNTRFGNMIMMQPYNTNGSTSMDDVISDTLDQLPESILDEIRSDIDEYCKKDDFESLANFLHEKKVDYKRMVDCKRKGIKMYNYDIIESCVDISIPHWDAKLLQAANNFSKDPRLHSPEIKRALFKRILHNCLEPYGDYCNFPDFVEKGLLQDLKIAEINLGDVNGMLLMSKMMVDKISCVYVVNQREKIAQTLSDVISKHIDKIKIKQRFIRNLQMLSYRCNVLCPTMHLVKNGTHEFTEKANRFAEKWIDYESTRQEECKLLFTEKTEWKCYQCGMMNKYDDDECVRCHKGINPLMIPKQNGSNTFCVKKPFGLIRLKPNVCSVC